jgi:hypothetical protein
MKKPASLIKPDDSPPQVRRSRRPNEAAAIQEIIERLEALDDVVGKLLTLLRLRRKHQQGA